MGAVFIEVVSAAGFVEVLYSRKLGMVAPFDDMMHVMGKPQAAVYHGTMWVSRTIADQLPYAFLDVMRSWVECRTLQTGDAFDAHQGPTITLSYRQYLSAVYTFANRLTKTPK